MSSTSVSCFPTSSSVTSFVRNSSQRSSTNSSGRHLSGSSSGQQQPPFPPPRMGSELTYGHLDQISSRRSYANSTSGGGGTSGTGSSAGSSDVRFGFSAHLATSRTSSSTNHTNPASNISSIASSWRTSGSGQTSGTSGRSGIHDTRLYHTLGRPMTTFNRPTFHDILDTGSEDNSIVTVSLPDQQTTTSASGSSGDHQSHSTRDNRYGSIPTLEASPRRYKNRGKEHHEFLYNTGTGNNLAVLPRQPADGASMSEIPPKLPEKPSRGGRAHQTSPPPLPPKKPIKGLIGVSNYNRRPHHQHQSSSMQHPVMQAEHPVPPDVISGSGGSSHYGHHHDDIYDFPPMPMLGSIQMDKEEARECISAILQSQGSAAATSGGSQQEKPEMMVSRIKPVSFEELSKMSLIELNNKLMSGHLPEELKGMSIMELVEYINTDQAKKPQNTGTGNDSHPTAAIGIKPSFSDNFVCDMVSKTNTTTNAPPPAPESNLDDTYEVVNDVLPNQASPAPPSSSISGLAGYNSAISAPLGIPPRTSPGLPGGHHHHTQQAAPHNYQQRASPGPPGGNQNFQQSSGFDDDFTPYSINKTCHNLQQQPITGSRPSSQATSDHSVLSQSKPDEFDKYAVFRELQMEEELIRAWKTPSDEDDDENTGTGNEYTGNDLVDDPEQPGVDDGLEYSATNEDIVEETTIHQNSSSLSNQFHENFHENNLDKDSSSYANHISQQQQPKFRENEFSSEEGGSPCSRSDISQSPRGPPNKNQSYSVKEDHPQFHENFRENDFTKESYPMQEEEELEENYEDVVESIDENDLDEETEMNKRDSQVPIFHQNDEDDDSFCQSIQSDRLKPAAVGSTTGNELDQHQIAMDENNVFNNAFGPPPDKSNNSNTTMLEKQSKTWTTFEDDLEENLQQQQRKSRKNKSSSFNAAAASTSNFVSEFQDNFGDSSDWSIPADQMDQSDQPQVGVNQSEVVDDDLDQSESRNKTVTRQASNESQANSASSSFSKCQRFSHRQCDSGHICSRGHSFEHPDHADDTGSGSKQISDNPDDSYTDWWPPSAEAGVPPSKKPVKPSSSDRKIDHQPPAPTEVTSGVSNITGSNVWGGAPGNGHQPQQKLDSANNKVFGEPLQTHFKVFSKVVSNPNNGFDPRSGTPNSNHFDKKFPDINNSDTNSADGLMPKSDSVNIFSIQADPFDDDFFQ